MKMEILKYRKEHDLDINHLLRVGDLIFFEGPLLTLFKNSETGHLYLFDWVDRDNKTNRWLVYRVEATDLLEFINGEISHFDLFDKRSDEKVYTIDIDNKNLPFYHYNLLLVDILPENYWPRKDNYFDREDCKSLKRIMAVINTTSENIKRKNQIIQQTVTVRESKKPAKTYSKSSVKTNN